MCSGGPLVFRAAGTLVICENRVAGGFVGESVVGGVGWRMVEDEKLRFSSSESKEFDRLGALLAPGSGGRSPYFLLSIFGESALTGLCIAWPCCRSPVTAAGFATGSGSGS